MSDEQRAKHDAVTVGQIRARQTEHLERQIADLSKLIRAGYYKRDEAEALLKGPIGETLTKLQNLDAMASTEVLFPTTEPTPPTAACGRPSLMERSDEPTFRIL